MMMEKKPPPPSYFRTKKWCLVLVSMAGVWLYYHYCERVIDILDSKEFRSDLGHENAEDSPDDFRAIKVGVNI